MDIFRKGSDMSKRKFKVTYGYSDGSGTYVYVGEHDNVLTAISYTLVIFDIPAANIIACELVEDETNPHRIATPVSVPDPASESFGKPEAKPTFQAWHKVKYGALYEPVLKGSCDEILRWRERLVAWIEETR